MYGLIMLDITKPHSEITRQSGIGRVIGGVIGRVIGRVIFKEIEKKLIF
jgi:hypothetical protein